MIEKHLLLKTKGEQCADRKKVPENLWSMRSNIGHYLRILSEQLRVIKEQITNNVRNIDG